MKLVITYWSGTGNTRAMAEALETGAKDAGAEVVLREADGASADSTLSGDVAALGCPAMGSEVLEEDIMEPLVAEIEKKGLAGKKILLFGSYDWGDGEWLRNWEERMVAAGAIMAFPPIAVHNAPEDGDLSMLADTGRKLAGFKA